LIKFEKATTKIFEKVCKAKIFWSLDEKQKYLSGFPLKVLNDIENPNFH